jgi:hypothetical protein
VVRPPAADVQLSASGPASRIGGGQWTGPNANPAIPFRFRYEAFDIRELPSGVGPDARAEPVPLNDSGPHDRQGVRIIRYGSQQFNQPVAQAKYGLALVESYRVSGNREYLDRAKKQARRLVGRRVVRGHAWFYPYDYELNVHSPSEKYVPPWFSMMAQGEALGLFSRLAQVTGDAEWRVAADATFAAFFLPPVARRPWGIYTVDGLLWLEEYPNPREVSGDRTYNGHIFSALGLWRYWVLTRNENAKLLLQGAFTTARDAHTKIRDPGWTSKYCIRHHPDAGPFYHGVHTIQHAHLYAITGDPVFAQIADNLYADFPLQEGPGLVAVAAGKHTVYRLDRNRRITGSRTVTLSRPSTVRTTDRIRITNLAGIWHRLDAGPLAGYHVRESDRAVRVGVHAILRYGVQRPGVVATAPVTAQAVDGTGKATPVTTSYRAGDRLAVSARGTLNGVPHVQLAPGEPVAGWIPAGVVTLA